MLIAEFLGWSTGTWAVVVAAVGVAMTVVIYLVDRFRPRSTSDPAVIAAAERENELRAEALEVERRRDQRERIEALMEQAPRWEAHEKGEAGYFTSDGRELVGRLRNVGQHVAQVNLARLDVDGQVATFALTCDPRHGGGGYIAEATVTPGSVMSMRCDITGMSLSGTARPSIYMDFTGLGSVTGELGVTIPLLRTGEDPRGHARWRIGEPVPGVLA
jgi:hypothetical protein